MRRLRAIGAGAYWRGWTSPLIRPILYVNIAAMAFFVIGVLFLAHYEERLIDAELDVLKLEARLIANALAESAVQGSETAQRQIDVEAARSLVDRLASEGRRRLQFFDKRGEIVVDSRTLAATRERIEVRPLPPPNRSPWNPFDRSWQQLWQTLISTGVRDHAVDSPKTAEPGTYSQVQKALAGEAAGTLMERPTGDLALVVAVPVQPYREIQGALRLVRSGDEVIRGIAAVRTNILGVFAVALGITIALSGFLAWRLAMPIRQLARAAEQLRYTTRWGDGTNLPDLSARRDEIGELSQALRSMTAALRRRVDSTERFATDVAHEIKNPIGSIQSAIETLKIVDQEEKRNQLVSIIEDDVLRINRLIQDISQASRLEGMLARGAYEVIDLVSIMKGLTQKYHDSAPIRIKFDENENYFVAGLTTRLEEVFDNLLENAVSFTPQGGTVWITLQHHAIESDGSAYDERQASGRWVRVVVEDEGPGLPATGQEKIFDRFYSDRPQDGSDQSHSGLGLALVAQIVTAHRGTIWAVNRFDSQGAIAGARFSVELPGAESPSES